MTGNPTNPIFPAATVRTVRTVGRHDEPTVRARPICPSRPSGQRPDRRTGPSGAGKERGRGGNCRGPCLFRSAP